MGLADTRTNRAASRLAKAAASTAKCFTASTITARDFPSANALRVVAVLEADDRDQSNDPADWTEWTPAYRDYIARKIDRAYRGY